ncbi:Na+/H+ antiporter subunit D [Lottiidibacillus patelloidae]|uniref:Na+/H+ antiporter subunit D n=1 Tax=Lottiidibacillus patelloidae TaxID=2670334 RepID=A0A263BVP9_9BACI|nr:Na+/H+ antiporter subunit D [Lottiidibacillus patelloidae]OZM57780.1 Na+/H+ antiporter subunit D [Lottiidibacillus patelloidae]
MSNLVILPILLPLLIGAVLIFFNKKIVLARVITTITLLVNISSSTYLLAYVYNNGTLILETGNWVAPFGIILVADGLATLLLVTTNLIAFACLLYTFRSLDSEREQFYFYTFFLMLITGVSGAFLTGDLFNLFVFFEVLLMASYGLIVLGGTKAQLRESLKYVLINLISSILFVITVAFLYSVTGTVNMAQLAERVGEVGQSGILTTIAILLFVVFATKGALFPLYFWLPKSYSIPPTVISALFGALLTKVGVYSILRVFTLIFVYDSITHDLFIWLAGFTMVLGVLGALSTNNIKLIIAYNIIPAIGFMMLGIGVFTATSIAGTVFYLLHDMVVKAALFLLVGAIIIASGTSDLRKMGGLLATHPLLSWLFFIAALTLVGIPPFSGFIGKLLLLKSAFEEGYIIIAITGLVTSLLILLSVIRIFIGAIWGKPVETNKKVPTSLLLPISLLVLLSIMLGVGGEYIYPYVQQVADQLIDPSNYIQSVLKG